MCVVVDEEENHRGLGGPSMSPRDACGETAESEAGLFPAEAAESDIFLAHFGCPSSFSHVF